MKTPFNRFIPIVLISSIVSSNVSAMDGSFDDNIEIEDSRGSSTSNSTTTTTTTTTHHPTKRTHADIDSSDDEADFSSAPRNVRQKTSDDQTPGTVATQQEQEAEFKRREQILNSIQINGMQLSDMDLEQIGHDTKKHTYKHGYQRFHMLNPEKTTNQEFESTIKHIQETIDLKAKVQGMYTHIEQLHIKAQTTATIFQTACKENNTTKAQQAISSLEQTVADALTLHQSIVYLIQSNNIDYDFIKTSIKNAGVLLSNIQQISAALHKKQAEILRHTQPESRNYKNARLQGRDLSGLDLSNANLTGADLSSAKLIGTKLVNAKLTNAILIGADLTHADLSGADLTGTQMMYAILQETIIKPTDQHKVIFDTTNLSNTTIHNVIFQSAIIRNQTKFCDADLEDSTFYDTEISNANFSCSNTKQKAMKTVYFAFSSIRDTNMNYIQAKNLFFKATPLVNVDFNHARIEGLVISNMPILGPNLNFEFAEINKGCIAGEIITLDDIHNKNKQRTNGITETEAAPWMFWGTCKTVGLQVFGLPLQLIVFLPIVMTQAIRNQPLDDEIQPSNSRITTIKNYLSVWATCFWCGTQGANCQGSMAYDKNRPNAEASQFFRAYNINSIILNANFLGATLNNIRFTHLKFGNCTNFDRMNSAQGCRFINIVSSNPEQIEQLKEHGASINGLYSNGWAASYTQPKEDDFSVMIAELLRTAAFSFAGTAGRLAAEGLLTRNSNTSNTSEDQHNQQNAQKTLTGNARSSSH